MTTSAASRVIHSGQKGDLFWLAFKTGLLTLVTLGLYRFWQKTRIRKYIWSSINAGGQSFEYTGTGLEKLLGFLLAVVFLAVYLGILQIVLFFFGISFMIDPEEASQRQILGVVAATYVSLLAVLPFLLFAVYRARRYKMARTRWRGIRFGMEKGAWGYVARAIGHGFLTLITLGALLPRQTFYLEKFMTDRSYFGTARFEQGGRWQDLYKAMKHLFIGIALLVAAVFLGALGDGVFTVVFGAVGYVWFLIGILSYRVQSFGYLTRNKTLGGKIGFASDPRTGTVFKTWLIGGLIISAILLVATGAIASVFGVALAGLGTLADGGTLDGTWLGLLAVPVAVYLVVLVLSQALSLVFITVPILEHYVDTIRIENPEAINTILQREADTGADAEGFADALDIGGAI